MSRPAHGGIDILLLRHGATAQNQQGRYLGAADPPLTPVGRRQLAQRAGGLPPVEAVFTSPLLRCIQSAEVLFPSCPAQIIPLLRERDFGEFEGKTHQEIISLPGFAQWGMTRQSMVFPAGEEEESFLLRCGSAFAQITHTMERQHSTHCAVICHGGVIMAIMEQIALPQRDFYHWQCGNGCGYHIAWTPQRGKATLIREL